MRAVENNTFYKRNTLTTASVLKANFSDLSLGGSGDTIDLQGGFKESTYTLSGSIPETPTYGSSKLIGGYLSVFVSGVTLSTTPTLPQLELYKLKPGVEVTEGKMNIAFLSGNAANTGINPNTNTEYLDGSDIVVYHSVLDSESMLMSESFDGADKTLGDITIVKSAGTGVVEMSDAYLTFADARSKGIGLGTMLGHRKTYSLRRYFSDGKNIPIVPEKGDAYGVWRPQLDERDTNNKRLIWKKPFWKYKDIKGVIKFKSKSPVGGSSDNDVGGSPGNTIFDEVYTTANLNNPFTSSEANPLLMTTCELSTTKKYGGAQSFRMYHLWDYSTASAQLQKSLGSKQVSPSMSRASIYNIPYPTWTSSLGEGPAPANYPVPEISMRMNISKLQFTPYITVNAFRLGSAGRGFTDVKSYYPTGTGSSAAPTFDATNDQHLTGFLRSVTVTWSNYKPKKNHDTIDKFLDYGLQRFYSGESSEHIVGGITFRKTGIEESIGGDPGVVMASAIPVQGWFGDGTSTGTTTLTSNAPGPNLKLGLSQCTMDGSAGGPDVLENTLMLGLVDWTNFATAGSGGGKMSNKGVRQVNLPLDSWFNMRTFIDVQQNNSNLSAQQNVYQKNWPNSQETCYKAAGSPMRVYFESEIPESGTTSDDDALKKVPFIDVYFPATAGGNTYNVTGNAPSGGPSMSYNWEDNPEMYPRHMTIWVQNYRWIDGTAASGADVYNNYEGSAGIFGWGDAQGAFPSGAAIEAELFVDNIDFKNFKPDITNCSPGASVATQQPITFRQEGNVGPRQSQVRSDVATWATQATRLAWEGNAATASGNMVVRDSVENILIGLSDPAQLPVVGTNSYTGFLLFNGFNSMQMGSIARIEPNAAISATSTYPAAVQMTLGGQNWSKGYYASNVSPDGTNSWYNTLYYNALHTTGDAGDISSSSYSTKSTLGNKGQINYMTYKNDGTGLSGIGPVSSQDGFTSKGLLRVYCSGTDVASAGVVSNWTKREHIMASTKIIGIPGYAGKNIERLNDNQLVVDDPTIFNKYLDDEFIIYLAGEKFTVASITASGNATTKGWGVHADSTSIKLAEGIEIDAANKIVTFNENLVTADNGSTKLLTEANLNRLWISPKKYWVSMYQPANKVGRSYQNAAVVQDVGSSGIANNNPITSGAMAGSTWNESTYGFDSTLVGTTGSLLTIDTFNTDGTWVAGTYNIAATDYTTANPSSNNTASFTFTIAGGNVTAHTIVTGGANYLDGGPTTTFSVPVSKIGGTGNPLTFSAGTVTTTKPPTNWVGRSGLYTSPWNLAPSVDDSTLVTNIDYGYGTYDEDTGFGGEVSQATALINKYVELDISRLASGKETSPGEDIVFKMGIHDGGLEKVHIYSDEYTSDVGKVPTIFWEYEDKLPEIKAPLTLAPNYDILSGSGQNKVDLYKLDREELNAIKFNWEEEGDDILYRLLFISTGSIINKYDDTAFHAPLNEIPNNNREATGSYYVGPSRIKAGNLTPSTTRTITGSSGWAWDGNYASSTTTADWPQTAASTAWTYFTGSKATFVAHCVPNDTTSQVEGVIFTDYSASRGTFKISYTKVGSANAAVTPVVSLTSGSTVVSGKTVTLTSDYSFPNDGEHPLFIVVTFNSTLDTDNIKMYVNGMLVKQSAGSWTKGNNLYNGASYDGKISLGNLTDDTGGTKKFRGTLQECIVYNTELYVPTSANEYVLSTASLPDKTAAGGSSIKYKARLFLFDYHNIIGSSKDLVCTSNEVSWEATPI